MEKKLTTTNDKRSSFDDLKRKLQYIHAIHSDDTPMTWPDTGTNYNNERKNIKKRHKNKLS